MSGNAAGRGGARRLGKRAETTARIEHCALQLFAERGFDETTIPQIAAAAGVSRATVFRYFPAKEDILFARHPREMDELRAALRAHPGAGTDRHEMVQALTQFIAFLEGDPDTLAIRSAVIDAQPQLQARGLSAQADFADVMARELAGGDEPALSTHVLASAVVVALVLAVRTWRRTGAGDDLRALLLEALSSVSFESSPPERV